MSLSEAQTKLLSAPLQKSAVKQRSQSGRNLSYIEGWHAISEANRIFGFGGWTRETLEIRVVSEKERTIGQQKTPGWGVTYVCKVRVIVDTDVVREGCGTGHGIDRDLGQAHESAIKEAETDAMKRALMTFGNQFGLALYDKAQTNVVDYIAVPEGGTDGGDPYEEPQGKYAIMLPKQERPYAAYYTEELWVMEMNDMIGKIRDSEKLSVEGKDKKLKDLEEANKDVIAALPEELRNGLML